MGDREKVKRREEKRTYSVWCTVWAIEDDVPVVNIGFVD